MLLLPFHYLAKHDKAGCILNKANCHH